MKLHLLLILVATITIGQSAAQATIITTNFSGNIINGARLGDTATGSFTYNDTRFVEQGIGLTIGIPEGLSFSFSFDNQSFNETHSSFPPGLLFTSSNPNTGAVQFDPVEIVFVLTQGINGVNFSDPTLSKLDILGFTSFGSLPGSPLQVEIEATYVPTPATAWLLFSALTGLYTLRKKDNC